MNPTKILVPLKQSHHLMATRMYSSRKIVEETYIQRSSLPSMTYQASLPRLPIPSVEETSKRYSKSVLPLYSFEPEKRKTIENIIKDFSSSKDITRLQQHLQSTSPKDSSFISKPWFDLYLRSRAPLPLNYNPFISLVDDPRPEANEQSLRAASFVYSIVRFRNSLRDQQLRPEVYFTKPEKKSMETIVSFLPQSLKWYGAFAYGAYPLDMSQYYRLFSSTRIPKRDCDILSDLKETQHITVLANKRFWRLDVADSDGNPFPRAEIMRGINEILEKSKQPDNEICLSVMTTANRDVWADVRKQMEESQTNRNSFQVLDSSIFLLCLDDDHPKDLEKLYHSFLIGNGENRFFDKSFSLILTKQGKTSINFEHAWGDGVAVVRLLNELYEDTTKLPVIPSASSYTRVPVPQQLQWDISDSIKKSFEVAKKDFDKIASTVYFNFYKEEGFGKRNIKKYNLSPDGLMQMCFQLAFGILHNGTKVAPTYESCSTAAFKHGRTETIRPVSDESVNMVKVFLESQDHGQRFSSLKDAISIHSQRVREAATGKGCDRHLFALKSLAEKEGVKVDLFNHESYSHYHHNILSTSTLTSKGIEYGGFGPVVDDGFGVAYGVENDFIGANVSSYGNHSADFIEAFKKSIQLIRATLENAPKELYEKK